MIVVENEVFVSLKKFELHYKFPIPKSAVMGANVADLIHAAKPFAEKVFFHTQAICDKFAVRFIYQIGIHQRPRSERHALTDHPDRRQIGIVVFGEVVIDEDFLMLLSGNLCARPTRKSVSIFRIKP